MRSATLWLCGILLVGMNVTGETKGESARALLYNAEGQEVGKASLMETPNGVLISLDVSSIPPGPHAFHIHSVGKCEPPFTSAGGHYNPMQKQHGIESSKGMHAGDLPNLHVPASGSLQTELLATQVTLEEGKHNSLFDEDGSALVIHAGPDDYRTDPAGAAGARVACGVIAK